jgi:SPP1 gp7 family putative phage head morphogenesis protein
MWRVTADPDRFDEAVAWMRRRVPVTKADYDKLSDEAKLQAFTIGGTQQLNVVQTVLDEIARSVKTGSPIEDFRERIAQLLTRDFTQKNSARLTTAYRTTTQTAYNAGRWFELDDPIVRLTHPYRIYDAVLDAHTTPLCISLDGKVYKFDDPFLLDHWPPLHFNCRTGVRAIRAKQAMDIGPQPPPKHEKPGEGFGLAPPKREKWEPERTEFDPKAFAEYERKQRALERKQAKKSKG